MGKIKKLQDKGATILPLTVADAVLMNSTEAGNLSTYLEALKSGVDFLLSIIGEDQAGDIFLKTKDGMPRGFYTEGFVSAGGKSTTEGGGGANLSQMWESLQGNNDTFKDRLINVAHIPTLTTGKISDFVSATQAIADTAVANKADKDKVVDLTSNQTISGEKTFSNFKVSNTNLVTNLNADRLDGLHASDFVKYSGGTEVDSVKYSSIGYGKKENGAYGNGPIITAIYHSTSLYGGQLNGGSAGTWLCYRGLNNGIWTNWKELAFRETTLSGYGITDGVKYVNGSADVDFSCVGYTTSGHGLSNGGLFTALGATGLYGSQLLGRYNGSYLYYRGKNNGVWTNWKQLAFTDNVLPITGGTLTGALTINAPINNTGALKLLGASEVSSTGMAVGAGAKALGSGSRAFGRNSIANGSGAMAFGELSQAEANLSFVFAYSGISARVSQTVLGRYNEEDVNSVLVIGSGTSDAARKNVFTVDANGYVRMGNRLHIGVGGQNEVYLNSDVADQLYVHTSAGVPFVIQGHTVRRGSSAKDATLGTNAEKWAHVYTEALKLSDANLTYDTGTLTIDKALTVASTLTAPQGVFSNYIKIGNATITYDSNNKCLMVDKGIASVSFVSAGGIEESSTIAELRQRVAELEAQLISLTNKE